MQNNLKISTQLENLNLSFNKLGPSAINSLCSYICGEKCELQRINLEANFLGDKVVEKLCNIINKNLYDKLLLLNLGQNNLSDEGASMVTTVIEYCKLLEVLILYWNKISNAGATVIVRAMKQHIHLKVFDISWNSIGNNLLKRPSVDELVNTLTSSANFNETGSKMFNIALNGMRKTMSVDLTKNIPPKPRKQRLILQLSARKTSILFT